MAESLDTLVAGAVSGDIDSLTQLLRRHGPGIQGRLHVGKSWRSLISSDDIMQVTYLEAYLQIGQLNSDREASFASWLEQIARNNLRDAIRGLSRQKDPQPMNRVQIPAHADSFVGLWEMVGATSATPSRSAGRDEVQQLLMAAIDQLPADYAAVVRSYDLDGRPIDEVAREMKRSTGAVHMLRARAHDRLRLSLGRESMFFSASA